MARRKCSPVFGIDPDSSLAQSARSVHYIGWAVLLTEVCLWNNFREEVICKLSEIKAKNSWVCYEYIIIGFHLFQTQDITCLHKLKRRWIWRNANQFRSSNTLLKSVAFLVCILEVNCSIPGDDSFFLFQLVFSSVLGLLAFYPMRIGDIFGRIKLPELAVNLCLVSGADVQKFLDLYPCSPTCHSWRGA